MANRFLDDVEMTDETRSACVEMCQMFHMSTGGLSLRYKNELGRFNYVTPTSYLELLLTFKTMLDKKRKYAFIADLSILIIPGLVLMDEIWLKYSLQNLQCSFQY